MNVTKNPPLAWVKGRYEDKREDVAACVTFTVGAPPTLRFRGTVVIVPLVAANKREINVAYPGKSLH